MVNYPTCLVDPTCHRAGMSIEIPTPDLPIAIPTERESMGIKYIAQNREMRCISTCRWNLAVSTSLYYGDKI
ncbi:unnamed protein product [Linum trigynum]|uniref:Uncharacterized protein n=1 Tax=Linum trigynum TaxID=586398 RepID=A0AAV2ELY3_9ROSI